MPGLIKTYYEVLGVDRQAPVAQIKSSYRRLAKRYHPDLNPDDPYAARQFQMVQAAYEILSDPQKRTGYDYTLQPDPKAPAAGPRAYRYYDWRSRPRSRPKAPGQPVNRPHQPRAAYSQYAVSLSLPEFFKGARRQLTIGQTFSCGRCRGRGKLDDGRACERCDSYGFVVSYRRSDIVIPPGLLPDMSIRLDINESEAAHPLLNAPVVTNICVTVQLKDSPPFEYRDHQLHTSTVIPGEILEQGGEWTIPDPEGGSFSFKVPAQTASGAILTLRKHGLRLGASSRRGNLMCTVIAV